jgi:hypothetical protein
MMGLKGDDMRDYDYDYHTLAEEADFIDDEVIEETTNYPEVYNSYYYTILKEIEDGL